jgi:DNA-binding CsgD family transcriptional regulator
LSDDLPLAGSARRVTHQADRASDADVPAHGGGLGHTDAWRGMAWWDLLLAIVAVAGSGFVLLTQRHEPLQTRLAAVAAVAAIGAWYAGFGRRLIDAEDEGWRAWVYQAGVPRTDLVHGIRAAVRGETVLAPTVASRLLHRVRQPTGGSLSPREVEVLRLVARGRSNAEIARELFIGESTVKTHLLRAFAKLGVSDRTAAVTTAMAIGLL